MKKMPYICLYDSILEDYACLSDAQVGKLVRALVRFLRDGTEPVISGPLRYVWPGAKNQMLRDLQAYEKRCEASRSNGRKGGRKKKVANSEEAALDTVHKQAPQLPKETDRFITEPGETNRFFSKPKKANENDNENENENDNENDKENEKESIRLLPGEASNGGKAEGKALAASPDERTGFSPPSVEQVARFCKQQGLQIDEEYFVNYYAARGWYLGNAPMRDWKAAAKAWAKTERRGKHGEAGHGEDVFAKAREIYGPIGRCL